MAAISDKERLYQLGHSPVGKLLWQYSLPSVVSMLVTSLYNVVDRIYIGQGVGPEAIAGLAVTLPVMNISAALGVLIGGGSGARVSMLLGAKDTESAFKVLGNALVLTILIAIAYSLGFYIFLDDILLMFGASEVTLPYAREFLLYMLPGFIAINLALSFNNVMRSSGYPMKAMVTIFIGTGINVVLDPLFIFGLKMGIKGAAIATVISMVISAIFVMHHFRNPHATVHFRHGIYRLNWNIIKGILAIGAAPSLINLAASFINAIINTSLLRYGGDIAVAAAGIFTTLSTLGIMTMNGISQGMQPVVGYNYGAGVYKRMRKALILAGAAATAIAAACNLVGLLMPGLWARAFTTSPELIAVTEHAFKVAFWAFFSVGIQVVATTYFQSINRPIQAIFMSLSRQVLFLIPLLLWLPGRMGLDGIWLAFPLGDIASTLCAIVLMWHSLRKLSA